MTKEYLRVNISWLSTFILIISKNNFGGIIIHYRILLFPHIEHDLKRI